MMSCLIEGNFMLNNWIIPTKSPVCSQQNLDGNKCNTHLLNQNKYCTNIKIKVKLSVEKDTQEKKKLICVVHKFVQGTIKYQTNSKTTTINS